jgi:hypothetical protein
MPVTSSTRRVLNILFWIAVIGLTLKLGDRQLLRTHAQTLSGTQIPYTVIMDRISINPDGSTSVGMTSTWAMRSDGSRAMLIVAHNGSGLVERILNFTSGKQIYIYDSTGKKMTTLNAANTGSGWLRSPERHCLLSAGSVDETVAGEETVDGYRTVRLTSGETHPDGKMSFWYTLDYGCAPIRQSANWGSLGVNDSRLVKLVAGEPSSDLFADPADYKEVPPSEVWPMSVKARASEDAFYYAHRPK